jgi:hypothetical protein
MSERDQVNEWTDIENVKSMYNYMKADRDGWTKLYFQAEVTSAKLWIAVALMAIPAAASTIYAIIWLCTHIKVVL